MLVFLTGAAFGSLVCLSSASALAPAAATEPAALRVPGPLSPRNASYQMTARLDEKAHQIIGHLVLSWHNLENRPADKLVFHLYQNAFKNRASTFIRETGPRLRRDIMPEHGYGAIDVSALKVGRDDLLSRAVIDDTLMTVPLPVPVGPSAAVQVEISFTTTLPKVFARSGYVGEFNAVSQWFPKIGVFDCQSGCRWRAHQYHGNTEFFADYGVYDVEVDVPVGYGVGATGVQVKRTVKGDRQRLLFHAEDVHDFVWMADPRFVEINDRIQDEWGGVNVRLLSRRGLESMNPRHLHATRQGLLELERRFGVYPYGNVTVVLPPADGNGAGGMEYPTLFTSVGLSLPPGLHVLEGVTAHELGHQYFYGIVGSDEVEEAFLDEGFNETFTTWAMERIIPGPCNAIDFLGLCFSQIDQDWLGYRGSLRRAPIATFSYLFPPETYSPVTYAQTAMTLCTLEHYLGPARMEAGMRRYVDRYRFHHPHRGDFTASFDQGAGEDLGWFWDQALTSTRVADYKVLSAVTRPHLPAAGLWDCPPPPRTVAPNPADPEARAREDDVREAEEAACIGQPPGRHEFDPQKDDPDTRHPKLHDSDVHIQRMGDFVFPVVVRMTFQDGSVVRETWGFDEQRAAGENRVRRFRYSRRPSALSRVEIDPDQTLLLDEHRLNNGLLLKPDGAPALRLASTWHGLVQTLIDLLAGV